MTVFCLTLVISPKQLVFLDQKNFHHRVTEMKVIQQQNTVIMYTDLLTLQERTPGKIRFTEKIK